MKEIINQKIRGLHMVAIGFSCLAYSILIAFGHWEIIVALLLYNAAKNTANEARFIPMADTEKEAYKRLKKSGLVDYKDKQALRIYIRMFVQYELTKEFEGRVSPKLLKEIIFKIEKDN